MKGVSIHLLVLLALVVPIKAKELNFKLHHVFHKNTAEFNNQLLKADMVDKEAQETFKLQSLDTPLFKVDKIQMRFGQTFETYHKKPTPNHSDPKTVLNMALMTWNAYHDSDEDKNWKDIGKYLFQPGRYTVYH